MTLLSRASRQRSATRADLYAALAALGLVAAALVAGIVFDTRQSWTNPHDEAIRQFGEWPVLGQPMPHLGPGTPIAVLIAVLVVARGPALAAALSWRAALGAGYLAAVSWTFALAMVDGWRDGVASRLARGDEYLAEVPGITDIGVMLRSFSARILDFQPDSWATHVSGHPPGATLVFVWLDRLGLGGGAWAGVACVLVGALAAIAVPVTLAALGSADTARAAIPFAALFPGAVWVGASADGLFTGVTSAGVALLALGARRAGARAVTLCVAAGLLLGFGVFLSYGLVLIGLIAVAVLLVARNPGAFLIAVLAALTVVATFAAAGFWWFDGYQLVVQRYYQGIGEARPYGYWVWANLACLVLAIGPATAAGLRRAAGQVTAHWRRPGHLAPVVALVAAAALAVLAADLSGLSKAEVERIWLPFAVWLLPAATLLPAESRRWWLAGQAITALAVNHLLLTGW